MITLKATYADNRYHIGFYGKNGKLIFERIFGTAYESKLLNETKLLIFPVMNMAGVRSIAIDGGDVFNSEEVASIVKFVDSRPNTNAQGAQ